MKKHNGQNTLLWPFLLKSNMFFKILINIVNTIIGSLKIGCFEVGKRFIII